MHTRLTRLCVVVALATLPSCVAIDDFSKFVEGPGTDAGDVDAANVDAGPRDGGMLDDGRVCGPETCNGVDDDCDGTVDEEPTECSFPNAVVGCVSGSCEMTGCEGTFLDCTADPGCETDPASDNDYCGSCDTSCTFGDACLESICRTPTITESYILRGTSAKLLDVTVDGTGTIRALGTSQAGAVSFETENLTLAAGSGLIGVVSPATVQRLDPLPVGASAMATTPAGISYLVGSFTGTVTVGGSMYSSRSGSTDGFFTRVNGDGSMGFFLPVATTGYDNLTRISLIGSQVRAVGTTDGMFPFKTSHGGVDAITARLMDGSTPIALFEQWGSTGEDELTDISVDTSGSYVAIGTYTAEADFGGATPIPFSPSPTNRSAIVASYDESSNLTWSVTARGWATDGGPPRVARDADGNVYWTIITFSMVDFGTGAVGGRILVSNAPDGSLRWARELSTAVFKVGNLAIGPEGDLYLSGTLSPSGDVEAESPPLAFGGEWDALAARIDSSTGEVVWATAVGGTGFDQGLQILPTATGTWLCGYFADTVLFGTRSVTASGTTSDGFLARIALE